MTFGSLFAGIGGMDLGLERAGMTCKWQVEIDPFARRVLEKHWPDVRRHDDVRTSPPTEPEEWKVDLICGGFPCQDISFAGKGAGLAGARSGLWYEYARIVRDLRPRFVLVENVAALLVRGLDAVLGTLASLGYDAEWHCIPAAALGAPHIRERVFILAYAASGGRGDADRCQPHRDYEVRQEPRQQEWQDGRILQPARTGLLSTPVADPDGERLEEFDVPAFPGASGWARRRDHEGSRSHPGRWLPEPNVGRVAHGVPEWVDRLRGLGNAVVPQVAEWIGRRILESVKETS